jgi:hypothetical protein
VAVLETMAVAVAVAAFLVLQLLFQAVLHTQLQ